MRKNRLSLIDKFKVAGAALLTFLTPTLASAGELADVLLCVTPATVDATAVKTSSEYGYVYDLNRSHFGYPPCRGALAVWVGGGFLVMECRDAVPAVSPDQSIAQNFNVSFTLSPDPTKALADVTITADRKHGWESSKSKRFNCGSYDEASFLILTNPGQAPEVSCDGSVHSGSSSARTSNTDSNVHWRISSPGAAAPSQKR